MRVILRMTEARQQRLRASRRMNRSKGMAGLTLSRASVSGFVGTVIYAKTRVNRV